MANHPHLRARGTPDYRQHPGEVVRALVYAPESYRLQWIDSELIDVSVQVVRTIAEVVTALTEAPPPRPQLLVADFDAMTGAQVLELHDIRAQGWFGNLIAIGKVPVALRQSLRIARVLTPPFLRDSLREAVSSACHATQTVRFPRVS